MSTADDLTAWATSGAMALTGRADGAPLGPPEGLVPGLRAAGGVLAERSAELGHRVDIDPLALLAERAATAGLRRRGSTSCGGGTRLVEAADGRLAVSLARSDDVELVPAWLGLDRPPEDVWAGVTATVAGRTVDDLVGWGVTLGLPVAALPDGPLAAPVAPAPLAPLPLRADAFGDAAATTDLAEVLVVDLSSLWAGPLCGSLLALAGARVVKVESTTRPDGARHGPAAFYDLLNADKAAVALDLATTAGRRHLAAVIAAADVVIEASRPRALDQLGIDATRLVADGGPRVWMSITGHGRTGAGRDRVAFGDDAGVAGGLVSRDERGPCFCADAVADPTSGLVAAAAVLDALAVGGRWLLDVSMAGVAAHLAGPTLDVPAEVVASPPTSRPAPGSGRPLGADTDRILAEVDVGQLGRGRC